MDAPTDLDLIEQLLARQPVEVRERLCRALLQPLDIARLPPRRTGRGYRDLAASNAETSGYAIPKATVVGRSYARTDDTKGPRRAPRLRVWLVDTHQSDIGVSRIVEPPVE